MSDDTEQTHTGIIVWVCEHCDMYGVAETGPDGKLLQPVTEAEITYSKLMHGESCKGTN